MLENDNSSSSIKNEEISFILDKEIGIFTKTKTPLVDRRNLNDVWYHTVRGVEVIFFNFLPDIKTLFTKLILSIRLFFCLF